MKLVQAAALAALVFGLSVPADAQQRQEARPGQKAEGGQQRRARIIPVEAALRMRDTLKLTDAQLSQLDALRKEIVTQRQNEASEMIELRSRLAAGLMERADVRKQIEARRQAARATMEQRREEIEKILTAQQREQLANSMRQRARATKMDRRGLLNFRNLHPLP